MTHGELGARALGLQGRAPASALAHSCVLPADPLAQRVPHPAVLGWITQWSAGDRAGGWGVSSLTRALGQGRVRTCCTCVGWIQRPHANESCLTVRPQELLPGGQRPLPFLGCAELTPHPLAPTSLMGARPLFAQLSSLRCESILTNAEMGGLSRTEEAPFLVLGCDLLCSSRVLSALLFPQSLESGRGQDLLPSQLVSTCGLVGASIMRQGFHCPLEAAGDMGYLGALAPFGFLPGRNPLPGHGTGSAACLAQAAGRPGRLRWGGSAGLSGRRGPAARH